MSSLDGFRAKSVARLAAPGGAVLFEAEATSMIVLGAVVFLSMASGIPVSIVDGKTRAPIENANVYAVRLDRDSSKAYQPAPWKGTGAVAWASEHGMRIPIEGSGLKYLPYSDGSEENFVQLLVACAGDRFDCVVCTTWAEYPRIDFELFPARELEVAVVDASGVGIPGVPLTFSGWGGADAMWTSYSPVGVTSVDGTWVLPDLQWYLAAGNASFRTWNVRLQLRAEYVHSRAKSEVESGSIRIDRENLRGRRPQWKVRMGDVGRIEIRVEGAEEDIGVRLEERAGGTTVGLIWCDDTGIAVFPHVAVGMDLIVKAERRADEREWASVMTRGPIVNGEILKLELRRR